MEVIAFLILVTLVAAIVSAVFLVGYLIYAGFKAESGTANQIIEDSLD